MDYHYGIINLILEKNVLNLSQLSWLQAYMQEPFAKMVAYDENALYGLTHEQ